MYYQKIVQTLPYQPPLETFAQFADSVPGALLESADIAPIYGRQSLFFVDPIVEIIGKGERFIVKALQPAGETLLEQLTQADLAFALRLKRTRRQITGTVRTSNKFTNEAERSKQITTATIIRVMLKRFATTDPYFGLYGAFSYDFVRLFEQLPKRLPILAQPDFHLYIPDLIYVYDHFKETANLLYFKLTNESLTERLARIPRSPKRTSLQFKVGRLQSSISAPAYQKNVQKAQEYMKIGDIFEVVLSRKFTASFRGSALGVYAQYRAVNPSPYMFYFRFPEQTVLGASPEMFVKVENNLVMVRPISGTAKRSADSMQDYQLLLNLLNSPKEKSELDMLIDLARNDVARVCKPGISLQDYRYVEKYSKVMHTIAHVTGQLDAKRYTAFDALIACLNAGTLTGAPKIRAMEIIEELEPVRRGLYGGCVGYLTFNNELNTGITIRSAVIEQGKITTQVGATLLLDSNPAAEFEETENKAAALVKVMQQV